MKLYIVYFRTMENSPEVTIECATTDKALAKAKYAKARAEAKELTEDYGDDEGNWYEAHMKTFDLSEERKPGDTIYVYVENEWCEYVETDIKPFLFSDNAVLYTDSRRAFFRREYSGLQSFDEDEPIEEAMHLEDPDVQADIYFSIEPVLTH